MSCADSLVEKERSRLNRLVIVEGKYDAARVAEIYDCPIVTTDGFGIFKNREKQELIKLLGERYGAIILTDSDRAGVAIRNRVKQILPADKIVHIYIPDVFGKERRKSMPSKEGKIGVEGIDAETIKAAFEKQGIFTDERTGEKITKVDLYEFGLLGGADSATKRRILQKRLSLPEHMSSNAFLQVLCALFTREEFLKYMTENQ